MFPKEFVLTSTFAGLVLDGEITPSLWTSSFIGIASKLSPPESMIGEERQYSLTIRSTPNMCLQLDTRDGESQK
jgi:hypothetical protein